MSVKSSFKKKSQICTHTHIYVCETIMQFMKDLNQKIPSQNQKQHQNLVDNDAAKGNVKF